VPGFVAPTPLFYGTDDNGNPGSGYLLYTYVAGTTTPAPTYADVNLSIQNANPVVLNAAGRATVFIPDASVRSYLFILKTPAGATVWSQDNISIPSIPAPAAVTAVPTGGMLPFGGTSPPAGFLLCDGGAVSRTTFAALFGVIGTAYGVGNGSTTFNVPDCRGRFVLGVAQSGTGSTLGGTAGSIDHTHTGPSHTHTVASHVHSMAHTHPVPRDAWGSFLDTGPVTGRLNTGDSAGTGGFDSAYQATADNTSGASSAANTGGQALTTDAGGTAATGTANPPLVTAHWIIKT
jgi:microcystin-dependent protein